MSEHESPNSPQISNTPPFLKQKVERLSVLNPRIENQDTSDLPCQSGELPSNHHLSKKGPSIILLFLQL
ncbi:uncharacterized protein P174DRAFT_161742 [Aspergillus novofumigatus IBT 16806]|uniref:Uncharacterized protein n=1 Tax=Aspergillus novofumigatus (strain IBT 16806) TaxID=1392255 RepID=A0A2I1C856_ASPN1|nr:uncharacterized protein P174DRAFT_161742 [Aspergillus novofumigatus IBT 16806]PKX93809.1 hypothetical protein P174DRAFT_161742 [Aspergillus novofumigatus IBT 16806]